LGGHDSRGQLRLQLAILTEASIAQVRPAANELRQRLVAAHHCQGPAQLVYGAPFLPLLFGLLILEPLVS
jgi:hypothetical protein